MKYLHKIYYFFGSFYFAIILIATVAVFVITGTFLESINDSHRYAATFTYGNPLFKALLWGFFINILLSALRRWPFKPRHIPFLITHWGMLMILSGVLIKGYFGTQGSIAVMEGSASNEVYITDSYALHLETKNTYPNNQRTPQKIILPPLSKTNHPNTLKTEFPELTLSLINHTPNSTERLETWFKQNKVHISGLKPFDVFAWNSIQTDIPVSSKVKIGPSKDIILDLYAIKTVDVAAAASKVYSQSTELTILDTITEKVLFQGNLEKLLNGETLPEGMKNITLQFNWSEFKGFHNPHLLVEGIINNKIYKISIPLAGDHALLNFNLLQHGIGKAPITLDLKRPPALVFIQDDNEDIFLFSFDTFGRLEFLSFRHDNLQTFIEYDQGYGGYAVQANLSSLTHAISRKEKELAQVDYLVKQFHKNLELEATLVPPLEILRKASIKTGEDFVEISLAFLSEWNKHQSWLYPGNEKGDFYSARLDPVIQNIDWKKVPPATVKGCLWCSLFFDKLDPLLNRGVDLLQALQELKWPLFEQLDAMREHTGPCKPEECPILLTALTQQIFSAAEQLPDIPSDPNQVSGLRLLSAYFRAYLLHFENIQIEQDQFVSFIKDQNNEQFHIETPVTKIQRPISQINKLEDNLPAIALRVKEGPKTETLSLGYDRFGSGFKWPMLQGKYLIRFQPNFEKIPYKIRVRQARQINYAGSQQPFSYECDLIVTDQRNNTIVEKTISMNNVHETWDGYRFYLANISPPGDGQVKRVQIVVNHDPGKYFLTYPGAFIMTLGIVLLFWLNPYKKKE